MPIDRAQFDADQAASAQATHDYIAAVDAYFASQTVIDFQAEDDVANGLAADIAAARSRIPGAPPPPPAPSP